MIIPAVMFNEMAIDCLKNRSQESIKAELKEFRSLGSRISELDDLELDDLGKGYLLGLETARALQVYGKKL